MKNSFRKFILAKVISLQLFQNILIWSCLCRNYKKKNWLRLGAMGGGMAELVAHSPKELMIEGQAFCIQKIVWEGEDSI
jgi:hypothetical protein